MKVGLLGDVHGNHLALAAVLAAAQKRGVEELLVTGDLIGYYFWPRECLELLERWKITVARGNHEDMLALARAQSSVLERIETKYGTGLRVALDTLSTQQLDWLQNLEHPRDVEIEGRRILLCHGAPWDVDQYIYPDADQELLDRCVDGRHDWIVLGHTHYPMQRRVGKTTIVNPGSVGQPRNRKPGAHWAVFDTSTGDVEQLAELYDIAWVVRQAKAKQPGMPYLWRVFDKA